jgi:hypothetical protein
MKFSSAILAVSLGFAFAHEDHGQHVPKLLGARKFLSELEARRRASNPHGQAVARAQHMPVRQGRALGRRQDDEDDQCGPGIGSCAAGYCCSAEGYDILASSYSRIQTDFHGSWCGKGTDYCTAPDCQINYGPGCDGVSICYKPSTGVLLVNKL